MRNLPATKLVKSDPTFGVTYYVQLAEHEAGTDYRISETRRLGFVERDGRRWYAYARRTDARMTVALGFYPTRKAAAQAVTERFVLMLAEVEAHEVQEAIVQSQTKADQEAEAVLVGNGSHHGLVVPMATLRALLGSNEDLAEGLKEMRHYLRHSVLLLLENVREIAYTHRMIEHELIRRANAEEQATVDDEFGGDFDGYADAMYRRETGEL